MSLRARLALTVLLAAAVMVPAVLWLRGRIELDATERALAAFALERMEDGGREDCAENPRAFPGRRGGARRRAPPPPRDRPPPKRPAGAIRFWAYDADFNSANERAPAFPPDLAAALLAGRRHALERDGEEVRVGVRMPWDDRHCVHILVSKTPEPLEHGSTMLGALLGLAGVLLAAVLAAAGPIVRRIRRLQRNVENPRARPVPDEGRDELGALARSFNEAFALVEKRERALRRFVANTTHDMMTPLTVLQGHLADGSPAALAAALEEAHYMGALMHNLSAAAKLEGGSASVAMHETDLNELVHRVFGRHRPLADLREIELIEAVPEQPTIVLGDVTLLEQCVGNLVHNAVRYNSKGGHVAIVLRRDAPAFELQIRDDGPGVSDEQLAQLTERRFRSEQARGRAPDGNGIGLHIAAEVAARHGFALRFMHAEGGGLIASVRGPTP